MKFLAAICAGIAQIGVVFGEPEATPSPWGVGQPFFTSSRIGQPLVYTYPGVKYTAPASVGPILSALSPYDPSVVSVVPKAGNDVAFASETYGVNPYAKAPFLTDYYKPHPQDAQVLRNIYRDIRKVNPKLKRSALLEELAQSKQTKCEIDGHDDHAYMDTVLKDWISWGQRGLVRTGYIISGSGGTGHLEECYSALNGVQIRVCWSRNDPLALWRAGKNITGHWNQIVGKNGNKHTKVGCTASKCGGPKVHIWCYLTTGDLGPEWDKYDREH